MKGAWCAVAIAVGLVDVSARADDYADVSVHVRFTTKADADAIQREACSPETRLDAPLAVRVERRDASVTCARGGATTRSLVVRVGEARDNRREVALAMDLGAHVSLERADEILDALVVASLDLERRLAAAPTRTQPLSPTLTNLGITLGALGLGAIIASYVWTAVLLVKPASCSEPLSVSVPIFNSCLSASEYLQTEVLEIAGGATMVLGAIFVVIGQQRIAVKPTKTSRLVPIVAPLRGGFAGGFTFVF